MSARVVDASVVAAIAFQEARTQDAERLLTGNVLYAPRLLRFEVTNVAAVKTRRDPASTPRVEFGLGIALAMRFRWEPLVFAEVWRLAVDTGLSAYDASYLWLARELSVPLVTFDRRLAVEQSAWACLEAVSNPVVP